MNKAVDKFLTKQQENVSMAIAEQMVNKEGKKTNLADLHFLTAMLMSITVLKDKNISNAER